jgi:hypothetical protein
MRRLMCGLGLVVCLAACGTDVAASPTASAPSVDVGVKNTCEAVGQAYATGMAPFAQAVTKAAGGTAADRLAAQGKLATFALLIDSATSGSTDAQLRADGKQAADQLKAKSADAKLFAGLKTQQDASTLLGPTLKEWLSPITHHCS